MSGGFLLVLALMLPAVGVAAMFAVPMRAPERIAWLVYPPTLAAVIAIAVEVGRSGEALSYTLGGWAPPLGLMLRADGASAVMMVMSAIVLGLVGLSACMQFHTPDGVREARLPFTFWALLLALWSALNLVFLAQDLFTLFVALELLTFAAVPLVCLNGKADTLQAALRYLLFALVGSVFYLLGVALIYGAYGMLDFAALRTVARDDLATSARHRADGRRADGEDRGVPGASVAAAGPCRGPAPASAVLSALVIKAPFFLIVRLWFDLLPAQGALAANMLAMLGAASILFCSVLALRQARLKLMIAYSTVAQVGYLFLMFPLATSDAPWETLAWSGGLLQLVSHAFAKAAMFVAAGLIAEALGHDRIDDLAGASQGGPHQRVRLRARRPVADGPAAERRLQCQGDADQRRGDAGAMVDRRGDPRRRRTGGRLCVPRDRQGDGGSGRGRGDPAGGAQPRGGAAGARHLRAHHRLRAAAALRLSRHRPCRGVVP